MLTVSACKAPGPEEYGNRGDPERFIGTESEIVQIELGSVSALDQLAEVVAQNPPSRAILNCPSDKLSCKKARRILDKRQIASESTGNGDSVALIYEQVTARDCEQRYVDNSSNPYNLHTKSFGCAITGNIVQMTTDKRQFTKPELLGYGDGGKAAQVYENYSKPAADTSSSEGGGSGGSGSSLIGTGSSQ